MGEPRDHHIVPQFLLKNFASDDAKMKISTVAKDGDRAIWKERSIRGLGYERDFYVHMEGGRPVSVETAINKTIETPISQSDTWRKIASGHSDQLDHYDRPILYSLVRHLESRTPHNFQTGEELEAMAHDPNSEMLFSDEEREMYAFLRANPDYRKMMFNAMTLRQFAYDYDRSFITVARTSARLRTTTTPTFAAPTANHPAIDLPLPGMVPFQRILMVDPHTMVSVIVGDFDGAYANVEMENDLPRGINRTIAGQFAKFPTVRHMVTDRTDVIEDMTWAPYELVADTPGKIVFKRKPET